MWPVIPFATGAASALASVPGVAQAVGLGAMSPAALVAAKAVSIWNGPCTPESPVVESREKGRTEKLLRNFCIPSFADEPLTASLAMALELTTAAAVTAINPPAGVAYIALGTAYWTGGKKIHGSLNPGKTTAPVTDSSSSSNNNNNNNVSPVDDARVRQLCYQQFRLVHLNGAEFEPPTFFEFLQLDVRTYPFHPAYKSDHPGKELHGAVVDAISAAYMARVTDLQSGILDDRAELELRLLDQVTSKLIDDKMRAVYRDQFIPVLMGKDGTVDINTAKGRLRSLERLCRRKDGPAA